MSDNNFDAAGESEASNSQKLTPELVKQVTDKVYKLFLKDLKRENERRRIHNPHYRR